MNRIHGLRLILPLLCLCMDGVTGQGAHQFPGKARAVIGHPVEILCPLGPSSLPLKWKVREKGALFWVTLVEGGRLTPRARGRFSFEGRDLVLLNATADDAGMYVCSVPDRGTVEVLVTVIEDDPNTVRWREDLRCGPNHYLPGLGRVHAECDPEGTYPCCSVGGWCGYTYEHCDRFLYRDYRTVTPRPQTVVTPAHSATCEAPYQLVSGKCVLYSDEARSWPDAETFCRFNGGELITFDSLDDLVLVASHLSATGEGSTTPFWVGVSAQGRPIPEEDEHQWRMTAVRRKLKGKLHGEATGCSFLHSQSGTLQDSADCANLHLPLCQQG